jgi:dipeptidase
VLEGRVLFAKNSDRDANEAQLLEWHPSATHGAGAELRCTWIAIPQVRETRAVLLSRPFWMWGAEIGANDAGVVIGNEAVFTKAPRAETGLTGMDLLRLALERAESAEAAVDTITSLLETHGQGGGCGHEDRSFSYHNSYLVADGSGAFVLETAGRQWQAERVSGARTISNGLTLEPFASRFSDRVRTWAADANPRRACTSARAERATGAADMMALLRDHGPEADGLGPRYRQLNGAMAAPCMHAGGRVVASQTTASWVSELTPAGASHWATGTAAPCTALFKPVRVDAPVDLGPDPTDQVDPASLWWRHEALHRRVLMDPDSLLSVYADERDALEAAWIADPPEPAKAFAEGDRRLATWERQVEAAMWGHPGKRGKSDRRPAYVSSFWARRDQRSGRHVETDGADPAGS